MKWWMRSSKRISHSCSWGWVTSSISSRSASAAARASPFIRIAASSAANPSSSARTSVMFTMSEASTAVTKVPRRGCTATRFSSARRFTASRRGVRPIAISRISSSSRSTVPGARRSVTMRSRSSTYARSATSFVAGASSGGSVVGSAAIGLLHRLGEQGGHVHDAHVVSALPHAVVEHDRTERTGDRERVGPGLRRLAGPLLVDLAGALLHPHVGAAGAAAEGALAAALHLDRLPDRGHQIAWALEHVVVAGEVAGVVVGDRVAVRARLEAAVAHQLGEQLGVVDHLVVAAEVRVLVTERVEAVRAARHDLLHAGLVQGPDVLLRVGLEQVLVAHAAGRVAGARLARAEDAEVDVRRLQELGGRLGGGAGALVER